MAVALVTAVERYQGLAADAKPGTGGTTAPTYIGATFLELDTGTISQWDGTVWRAVSIGQSAVAAGGMGPQLRQEYSVLDELLQEVRKLRLGLVYANDAVCVDVEGDLTPLTTSEE